MDLHNNLKIKLQDAKPKATLMTKIFSYELLCSATTKSYMSIKQMIHDDSDIFRSLNFTCISEHMYIEFINFFQFLSLSQQI